MGNVVCMEQVISTLNTTVGKHEWKRSFGRHHCRWEDVFLMYNWFLYFIG
jgi:hypothetical protein